MKDMIYATMITHKLDWPDVLPIVEMGLRVAEHSTLKFSPSEIVFGKLPNIAQFKNSNEMLRKNTAKIENNRTESRLKVWKMMQSMKENAPVVNRFNVGDMVMIRNILNGKLGIDEPRYMGPGKIIGVINPKSYWLSYNSKTIRRHEDHLKAFNGVLKKEMREVAIEDAGICQGEKRKRSNVKRYGFDE